MQQERLSTVSGTHQHQHSLQDFTRDFTFGTEFKGVTTFDTQGYFVPPSGTTDERPRFVVDLVLVVFMWWMTPAHIILLIILQYQLMGNAQDFGDLQQNDPSDLVHHTTERYIVGGTYSRL